MIAPSMRALSTHCASESCPHRWHDCQVAEIIWPEFSWVCGTQGVQSVQYTTALPLISGTAAAKKLPSRCFLLYLSFWGRSFYVTRKTLSSGSLSSLWGVATEVTLPIHSETDQISFCQHSECNTPPWSLAQRIIPREAQGTASPAIQSLTQSLEPELLLGLLHWSWGSSLSDLFPLLFTKVHATRALPYTQREKTRGPRTWDRPCGILPNHQTISLILHISLSAFKDGILSFQILISKGNGAM